MTDVKMKKPGSTVFKPRICFFDRKKCTECGTCQKTYYCDSFLDRVNTKKLPPVMDTRNCSGCGLCVQVCTKGALHLYHPKEFIILISSSEERRELLRSLDIPFLAYDPEEDFSRFSQPDLQKLTINPSQKIKAIQQSLRNSIKKIWENRQADLFILGDNKSEDYKDEREDRKQQCEEVAEELINTIDARLHPQCNLALARAALWSQLIWSDPGQVLWDSFLLSVQTYLESGDDNQGWNAVAPPDNENLQPGNFEKESQYRISSYVVLLRQGEIILSQVIPSNGFNFSAALFDSQLMVDAYNKQGMGKNRLAGLDIRSCGHFLIKDFEKIKEDDRLAMAGLPWPKICELLSKIRNEQHTDDFAEMCRAMKKRNE